MEKTAFRRGESRIIENIGIPRVVIAGTSSGSGKTTVTCAVLAILKKRSLFPVAFKCGPDYLDPMFHSAVIGVESANLDPFFLDGNGLKGVLCTHTELHSRQQILAVIEGVMGYYDGTGEDGLENSTYAVAEKTESPVILVVSGKGASTSILAQIEGFQRFVPDSRICGVIVNQTGENSYMRLKKMMMQRFGGQIKPVGYLPALPDDCILESRHLGLVAAREIDGLLAKLEHLASIAEKTLDVEGLISIAGGAEALSAEIPVVPCLGGGKIAVASDAAFCFYYEDTLKMLERLGAEIAYFSPLKNEAVPPDSCGLYLGGGYPELYGERLAKAGETKASIVAAVGAGVPVIAECGGFMYLCRSLEGHEMCGILPGECSKGQKLVRFGYVDLKAPEGGLFGGETKLKGHEFHYCDSTDNGGVLTAEKTNGIRYTCGFYDERMYAGFPHLYLPASPGALVEFYQKCLKYKETAAHREG